MLKKYKDFNENIEWEFFDEEESIHPDFIGHEKFYNFLVNNKILNKFINNYYKYKFYNINLKEFLNKMEKENKSIENIDSFYWSETNEGEIFWSKYNKKWQDYILYN